MLQEIQRSIRQQLELLAEGLAESVATRSGSAEQEHMDTMDGSMQAHDVGI